MLDLLRFAALRESKGSGATVTPAAPLCGALPFMVPAVSAWASYLLLAEPFRGLGSALPLHGLARRDLTRRGASASGCLALLPGGSGVSGFFFPSGGRSRGMSEPRLCEASDGPEFGRSSFRALPWALAQGSASGAPRGARRALVGVLGGGRRPRPLAGGDGPPPNLDPRLVLGPVLVPTSFPGHTAASGKSVRDLTGGSAVPLSFCGVVSPLSLAVLQSASLRFSAAVKSWPRDACKRPGPWDRLCEYGTSDPWSAYHRWPVSPQRGRTLFRQDRPAFAARKRRGPSCEPLWGSLARFRASSVVLGPCGALWRALARCGRPIAPPGAFRARSALLRLLSSFRTKRKPPCGGSLVRFGLPLPLYGLRHLGPKGPLSSIRGAVNVRCSCFGRASHGSAASS